MKAVWNYRIKAFCLNSFIRMEVAELPQSRKKDKYYG